MKCKACGAKITKDAKFCNICGAKVEEGQDGSKPKPKKKILKYIGIAALVYVVLSVVITALNGGIDDSETRAETYLEESNVDDNLGVKEDVAEVEAEKENEQLGTIMSATAQSENDLTGTYEDTEMSLKLILIQNDGMVTYNFCNSDGTEPIIETECKIENDYIKEFSGVIRYKINGNRIQEFSGRTIARFDTSYIHDFSGAIQYKLDGFFSRRELMAILAIIYGN